MSSLKLNVDRAPHELRQGLAAIREQFPHRFASGSDALAVQFKPLEGRDDRSLAVKQDSSQVLVRHQTRADAFRALGRLLGGAQGDFSETARFDMRGIMIDVSRNAVLRPDTAQALMCRLAMMGINVLMLYAEDTYEVPGEPFFGYLRGRYTHDEMKSLDKVADGLGIEMFPCIQTLGHLQQILQWPVYAPYQDTNTVILADEEPTYVLLEKMIRAASTPFRSKRIHIGMDEAVGIGTENYLKRHASKRPFDVLNAHLDWVRRLCVEQGLHPMIWSDMYFRLGSSTHDYYDRECEIPQKVVDQIPKDVQLVYWDYYHLDQSFYEQWIDRHRALGSDPIMARGPGTDSGVPCLLPAARPRPV